MTATCASRTPSSLGQVSCFLVYEASLLELDVVLVLCVYSYRGGRVFTELSTVRLTDSSCLKQNVISAV